MLNIPAAHHVPLTDSTVSRSVCLPNHYCCFFSSLWWKDICFSYSSLGHMHTQDEVAKGNSGEKCCYFRIRVQQSSKDILNCLQKCQNLLRTVSINKPLPVRFCRKTEKGKGISYVKD